MENSIHVEHGENIFDLSILVKFRPFLKAFKARDMEILNI